MRKFYLDNLKGFLIILVILGHVVQGVFVDYQHNFLFRAIYSFHMPLFFFISGYLTWKKVPDSRIPVKRAKQLLLPFIFWAYISPLIYQFRFDIEYTINVILYPDNGLWFLYNLFVYSFMIWLSQRVSCKRVTQEMVLTGLFFVVCVLMVFFKTKFNCSQICWYFPFFALGFYFRKYESKIIRYKLFLFVLGGGIWIIGVPFWMMREPPLFYQWINLGGAFSYCYRYLICFSGTCFFFFVGQKFFDSPIKFISMLGKKTLGIYAIQFSILYYIFKLMHSLACVEHEILIILLATVFVIAICALLVSVIEKVKYVRLFLIGKE